MATRVNRSKTRDDPDDSRVAAFIPVNGQGEQVGEMQEWQMPVGSSVSVIPDDEPLEETATDRVRAMLSNVGSDATARVQIFRVTPGGGKKLIFVDEMPPDDFERGGLKMIANNYGAGDYEIRLYGSTGDNGAFGLRSRVRVSVEAAPKVNPMQGASDLSAVLAAMQEQNSQLLRAIADKPQADPMAQMTQMFTMMKLMREATGETGGGKGSDLTATLALVRELKGATELFEPAPPADASPFGMVKDMLPMITAAMQSKPAAQLQIPQSIAAPPVSLAAPDPFANIMELPMLTLGQKIKLRGTLATLLELAKNDVEHEEGVTLVLDALPDEMLEVLAADEWWDTFAQIVPSAVPYQAWFFGVRDRAIAEWTSEDTDDDAQTAVATPAAPAAPAAPPAARLKRAAKPAAAGPADAAGTDAPGT